MKNEETDACRLGDLLMQVEPGSLSMLYRDTFVAGCFLYAEGHRVAGLKLCNQVLNNLNGYRQKTYFDGLIANLPGNERRFAGQVSAHRTTLEDLFGPYSPE